MIYHRFRSGLPVLLLLLSLLGSACVTRDVVSFEDEGTVCPMSEDYTGAPQGTMNFNAGERVTFRVWADVCLSSACDVNRHMECEVVADGTTLMVHSWGGYTAREGYVICTDDCALLNAECTTEPLDAGEYVIVHGDERLPLTVPSSVQSSCELGFY